jgi:hypothetical protein
MSPGANVKDPDGGKGGEHGAPAKVMLRHRRAVASLYTGTGGNTA